MRYRLTKAQAQMLIDGKRLKTGHISLEISEKEDGSVKKTLKEWLKAECPFPLYIEIADGNFILSMGEYDKK